MISELNELPPGEAIFDMDGTLIANDVAEACLRGLDRSGHRNRVTEGAQSVFAAYQAIGDYAEQCRFAALALGGLRYAEIEALVGEAFDRGETWPIAPVVELAKQVAQRHRVWILTASPEVLGVAVGKRLGIHNVFGIKLRIEGGVYQPEQVGLTTCGEGKVTGAWVCTGRRPVFAIGDSPHDLPILRHARVARSCGKIAGVEFAAFPG